MRKSVMVLITAPAFLIVSCGPTEPTGRWTRGDEAIEFLGDGKAILTGKTTSIPMTYAMVDGGRLRLDAQQSQLGASGSLIFDFNPKEHTLTNANPDGSKTVFYEISRVIPKALLGTWRSNRLDVFWKDSLLYSSDITIEVTYLPDGEGLVTSFPDRTDAKPYRSAAWVWADRLYQVEGSPLTVGAYGFKVGNDTFIREWRGVQTVGNYRIDRSVATFTRRR